MSTNDEINNGHYFEVMDRAHILMSHIENDLVDHPAITAKQRKRLEKAQDEIMKVYQWAGRKHRIVLE